MSTVETRGWTDAEAGITRFVAPTNSLLGKGKSKHTKNEATSNKVWKRKRNLARTGRETCVWGPGGEKDEKKENCQGGKAGNRSLARRFARLARSRPKGQGPPRHRKQHDLPRLKGLRRARLPEVPPNVRGAYLHAQAQTPVVPTNVLVLLSPIPHLVLFLTNSAPMDSPKAK